MDEAAAQAHVAARLGVVAGPTTRLTGGKINHVFRVALPGGSVVLKHAPPHLASLPAVALDPVRADFEARALRFAETRADRRVRCPRLLDQIGPTLILEDLGDAPALDGWLAAGGDPALVARLGAWLRGLHEDAAAPLDINRDIQAVRLSVQYAEIGPLLARAGHADSAALGAVALALGRRFLGGGPVFLMGDLWPPSVRVSAEGSLQVLDWEMSGRGHRAQDLGHLLAHLWMGAARQGLPVAAQAAFLQGYGPLDPQDAAQTAAHFACELLVRVLGPFRAGSPYDGLPVAHPAVQAAVAVAAAAMATGRLPAP
jgi:hypothetical protein